MIHYVKEAKKEAYENSVKDQCVQHVNEISDGVYKVESWFDFSQTVASWENGVRIF